MFLKLLLITNIYFCRSSALTQFSTPPPQQQQPPAQLQPQQIMQSKQQNLQQQQQQQQQQFQSTVSNSPMTPIVKQKCATPHMQPQHYQEDSLSRVRGFTAELDEFKTSVAKLFGGKDLSKQLLSLGIVKDTKKTEEAYLKLIGEMKTLVENCSQLRTTVLGDFHNFEKLRLLKFHIEDQHRDVGKILSSIHNQHVFDMDPFTRNKLESVKKLYAYLQREIPNMRSYIEAQQKRRRQE